MKHIALLTLFLVPLNLHLPGLPLSEDAVSQTELNQDPSADLYKDVQKLDLKAGMHPPKVIHSESAAMTQEAREKNIGGRCLVSLVVDAEGAPKDIHLIRCTNAVFEESSLRSIAGYKFKPATTADRRPTAVRISFETNYLGSGGVEFSNRIRYTLSPPPGWSVAGKDSNGIYPFSNAITPPAITKFSDQGYGKLAFGAEGSSPCEVVLTIDAQGKAADPAVARCDRPILEKSVVASLLASHYEAGSLNGNSIPVRALVHIEYGDSADH